MRLSLCLVAALGACAPKLPPVVPTPDGRAEVDPRVPAQARAELLHARRALEAGQPELALAGAHRAANLDQRAAAPWALVAEAECARGERAAALAALEEAIAREPEVAELRRRRVQLGGSTADIDWLGVQGELTRPGVAVEVAAAVDPLPPAVLAALRTRVSTDQPGELQAVFTQLARAGVAPAVVLAGLRLYGRGPVPEEAQPALAQAAASLGVPPGLLPQDWRTAILEDSGGLSVGYALEPTAEAGWQAAREGRLDEAVALLSASWQADPSDADVADLLWVLQGPAPLTPSADPFPSTQPECR